MLKITTNKGREFTINIDNIPLTVRNRKGFDIFKIANDKLQKGEEIVEIDYVDKEQIINETKVV